MRLELGGGLAPAPGHINIDLISQADIVWDLNYGLPLNKLAYGAKSLQTTGYIEGIRCHQLLEHLDTIIPLMNDAYKIIKEGAELELSTPYALSKECWADPTHKRGYTPTTFEYFIKDSPFKKEQDEYKITARFTLIKAEIVDGWNIEVTLRK